MKRIQSEIMDLLFDSAAVVCVSVVCANVSVVSRSVVKIVLIKTQQTCNGTF